MPQSPVQLEFSAEGCDELEYFAQPGYEPAGEEPGGELGDVARRLRGPFAALQVDRLLEEEDRRRDSRLPGAQPPREEPEHEVDERAPIKPNLHPESLQSHEEASASGVFALTTPHSLDRVTLIFLFAIGA